MTTTPKFKLTDNFIAQYKDKQPDWGYGLLSYTVYKRTYSALKEDNTYEEWWETIRRVVEGSFRFQQEWCEQNGLLWDAKRAQISAQNMYEVFFNMWALPSGRGLQFMGTKVIDIKGAMPLYACAFVSTENISKDFSYPFCFMMDLSALGTGVGFDTRGAGTFIPKRPKIKNDEVFIIPDSREGWVESLKIILDAYSGKGFLPGKFDYSLIRPAGTPLKVMGGTATGPEPLQFLHQKTMEILSKAVADGTPISSTDIVDIMNLIGKAIVAGGVRRTAMISFGDKEDTDFLNLKNPTKYPEELKGWRWASNNSIFAEVGMNYEPFIENIAKNGEPGFAWLENMKHYGRLKDGWGDKDLDVMGGNPCQPAWATVLTPKGISTIGEINIGDTIWSGSKWTKVTNKWSTGRKQIYGYITPYGAFWGTKTHKVVGTHKSPELDTTPVVEKIEIDNAGAILTALWPEELQGNPFPIPPDRDKQILAEIIQKVHGSTEEVFDITVDCPEHTYWTGGLLVSNCLEASLENAGTCNLLEIFLNRIPSFEIYKKAIKAGYLYTKSVGLKPTHRPEINAVIGRNRRIGTSITGITQFIQKHSYRDFINWCDLGYNYIKEIDKIYSKWLCIPESIKVTVTKPSGSVSLLSGSTPGVHFPESEYYIRRIKFDKYSSIPQTLSEVGYHIEDSIAQEDATVIVEIPIQEKDFYKSKADVSIWEQMALIADVQYYWADQQVSATVTFKEEEIKDLKRILEIYETRLKGISFLPYLTHTYKQAPYEAISKEEYEKRKSNIKVSEKEVMQLLQKVIAHDTDEKYCSGDKCELPFSPSVEAQQGN